MISKSALAKSIFTMSVQSNKWVMTQTAENLTDVIFIVIIRALKPIPNDTANSREEPSGPSNFEPLNVQTLNESTQFDPQK